MCHIFILRYAKLKDGANELPDGWMVWEDDSLALFSIGGTHSIEDIRTIVRNNFTNVSPNTRMKLEHAQIPDCAFPRCESNVKKLLKRGECDEHNRRNRHNRHNMRNRCNEHNECDEHNERDERDERDEHNECNEHNERDERNECNEHNECDECDGHNECNEHNECDEYDERDEYDECDECDGQDDYDERHVYYEQDECYEQNEQNAKNETLHEMHECHHQSADPSISSEDLLPTWVQFYMSVAAIVSFASFMCAFSSFDNVSTNSNDFAMSF